MKNIPLCKDCGKPNTSWEREPDYCWACWSKHPCPVCKSPGHSTPDGFCTPPVGCAAQGKAHKIVYPNFRGNGNPAQYDDGYCTECGYKPANIY